MSKTRKPSRRRAARRIVRERAVDVITQLEIAARHPQAALLGAFFGGAVPWFARALAHEELPIEWAINRPLALVMLVVILGCAAFSMLTVYKFGLSAFGDRRKAIGFVAALEGVMLVTHGTTSLVALLLLVAINAIANGCVIAGARDATLRRQEADRRRSATRAENRTRTRGVGAPAAQAPAESSTSASTAPATAPAKPTARRARRPIPVVVVPPAPRAPYPALDHAIDAEWEDQSREQRLFS